MVRVDAGCQLDRGAPSSLCCVVVLGRGAVGTLLSRCTSCCFSHSAISALAASIIVCRVVSYTMRERWPVSVVRGRATACKVIGLEVLCVCFALCAVCACAWVED